MTTFETILLILLVVNAIALAGFVLLQHGKGADVGAAFGSGAANTIFGARGSASFLTKATAWLSIGFFVISFLLAYTAKERAAGLRDEGMPEIDVTEQVATPERVAPPSETETQSPPGGELTPPEEKVDSDIPDV
jgi:preprotein translocase subunit SecG